MNTVSNLGLYSQPTSFQSKIKKPLSLKTRSHKVLTEVDKAHKQRLKSFKDYIRNNPEASKIIEDMNAKKMSVDDAAKQILDTII